MIISTNIGKYIPSFLVASTLATGGILFNGARLNEDGFFGPEEAPNGGKSPRKDFGNSSGLLLFRVKVALNSFSALLFVLVISFLSGCGVLTDKDSDLSLCSDISSSFLKGNLKQIKIQLKLRN